jgi:Cobalamin-independent synthase, Catalytic domain
MTEPRPWGPGAVTALGSLPGDDPVEAAALIFGELPDLPHLAELPARGPGADMIGRTAALLVDLPVEVAPTGWRFAAHAGRDVRLARDMLARDLDALEQAAEGYRGPLKLQAAGPWTLAAALELPAGHRAITDHGATRDLAESLTEGLRIHLAEMARRVPGADVILQLDEPTLPAALAGHLSTPSGFGTVAAVDPIRAEQVLRDVLAVAPSGRRVVHCCAADVPLALLRAAGADALAIDPAQFGRREYDALGEAIDAGVSLWLGVLPATDAAITLDTVREPIRRLWDTLGFPLDQLAAAVVPTPSCGLAGASPDYVRRVMAVLRDAGSWLREL